MRLLLFCCAFCLLVNYSIAQTVAVGRAFATRATEATAGLASPELSTGFCNLTDSLFVDLPG